MKNSLVILFCFCLSTSAQVFAPAYNKATDITNGLQLNLLFHGNITDTSLNALGTSSAGTVAYTTGQDGISSHAVIFNGSNTCVFSSTTDYKWFENYAPTVGTCCMWIKIQDYGSSTLGGPLLVFEQGPPDKNFNLNSPYNSSLPLTVSVGDNTNYHGNASFTLSQWYFVGATYDGSKIRLFVNGVQTGIFPQWGPPNKTSGKGTQIGRYYDSAPTIGAYFNGYMQDFRIYNRALSAAEMNQLFQNGAR